MLQYLDFSEMSVIYVVASFVCNLLNKYNIYPFFTRRYAANVQVDTMKNHNVLQVSVIPLAVTYFE